MIFRCSNCGSALQFDAITQHMCCDFCGSFFQAEEFAIKYGVSVENMLNHLGEEDDIEEQVQQIMMETNIYSCSACGASIMMNEQENASFCAYCGQPFISFERVDKVLRPKYIIPFKLSKQEALDRVSEELKWNTFAPKRFKHAKAEDIHGIYVPYWLFDVKYHDRQFYTNYFGPIAVRDDDWLYREAVATFTGVTYDGSINLSNEMSMRLEPFDRKDLKEFTPAYLSGYYSDCYDVNEKAAERGVVARCKELFDNRIRESVHRTSKLLSTDPEVSIEQKNYVMLPVWFLSMREKGKVYNLMVNGQTGKVVGTLPYRRAKLAATFLVWFVCVFAVMFYSISRFWTALEMDKVGFMTTIYCILFVVLLAYQKNNIIASCCGYFMGGLMVLYIFMMQIIDYVPNLNFTYPFFAIGVGIWLLLKGKKNISYIKSHLSMVRNLSIKSFVGNRQGGK